MKTIGLIGITSVATAVYFETINRLVGESLGAAHSAKILLYSINFEEFKTLMTANDWAGIEKMLAGIARKLETGGADCILMCSNTPHVAAAAIQSKIQIPLIHIADETARACAAVGAKRVGLLGTRFTMEAAFFKDSLAKFGLEILIPDDADRDFLHESILSELTQGVFREDTKNRYLEIIEKLRLSGADAVIFGCTEIHLLMKNADCGMAVFDTTAIHCRAAADFALSGTNQSFGSSSP